MKAKLAVVIMVVSPALLGSCGSGGDSNGSVQVRWASRPERIEAFAPADLVFVVEDDGGPVAGHAVSLKIARAQEAGSQLIPTAATGSDSTASHMQTQAMLGGNHRAEVTFLEDGHHQMEAITAHDGEEVIAMHELDVEKSRKSSGEYTITFAAGPVMEPTSGDMHRGDEASFEFLVARADGSPVTALAPTVVFVSPDGTADSPVQAEHKGNGVYSARRSLADGKTGIWKVRFSSAEGTRAIEAEFQFPVSEHGGHEERVAAMEMHADTMMNGMHTAGGR